MRGVISGLTGVARGALWTALALAAFFAADSVIFRAGWYNQYLEPQSSTGAFEAQLYWLENSTIPRVPEVLVIGDSRIAEGFSSRTANAATDRRLHFWNFGLGGTTPRVWYYMLRAADPTRRRFAAIAIAMDNYSDADTLGDPEDRVSDQNYVVMRLGLDDCLDFAASMRSWATRQHALFGCLFRGVILRDDMQTFLSHPKNRIARADDWLQNGLAYNSDYGGKTENLRGLVVDFSSRKIHFPEGIDESTRANVTRYVLREPVPQTGEMARYRRRWLGGILDLYRDSPTRLIFFQLPRGPVVDPDVRVPLSGRFVDAVGHTPRVDVLPADLFTDLERPELFADGLHLNRDGRPVFSTRLAKQIDADLARGGH